MALSDLSGGANAIQRLMLHIVPALIGPGLLLLWHPRLLAGASRVHRRSFVGLCLISALTAVWFFQGNGWLLGVTWQGARYVWIVFALNVALLALAWALLIVAHRRRAFVHSLMFHSLVVAWLVWVAFPWLGD
jgi:hypothetical protein